MTQNVVKLRSLLDVLLALRQGRKSFKELRSLALSPSTVLSRLRESQRKGWVRDELSQRGKKRSRITYRLTEEGKTVLDVYDPVLPRYRELREEFEKLQEEVREKEKEMRYLLSSIGKRKASNT